MVPLSSLWKAPPAFLEQILSSIRVLENAVVQRAMRRMFRRGCGSELPAEMATEVIPAEAVSAEAVSSEALT